MKTPLYTVEKIQGLWDVLFAGRAVRTFFTEAVARLYAACWNADRQPSNAEIAEALVTTDGIGILPNAGAPQPGGEMNIPKSIKPLENNCCLGTLHDEVAVVLRAEGDTQLGRARADSLNVRDILRGDPYFGGLLRAVQEGVAVVEVEKSGEVWHVLERILVVSAGQAKRMLWTLDALAERLGCEPAAILQSIGAGKRILFARGDLLITAKGCLVTVLAQARASVNPPRTLSATIINPKTTQP